MTAKTFLSLEEFWALPEGETAYELVDGQATPKVSPKFFHSTLQKAFLFLIHPWSNGIGRVEPEWAITLKRNGKDWVPTPDITYISYQRLSRSWRRNEACPVPPELVIEIISPREKLDIIGQPLNPTTVERRGVNDDEGCPIMSSNLVTPGQTLREFEEKAEDYFASGVSRVWVVDPEAVSIRAFFPGSKVVLYADDTPIVDDLLPGLELTTRQIFEEAELI